ncbi:MAG: AMIN domain-containing protein [bacterium]
MTVRPRAPLICCVALAILASCASRKPAADLNGEESVLPTSLPGMSIPLDVREFEVVPAENGARGVFIKLSRLPSGVTHRLESGPTRIVLDIAGPTGTESAEEVFPANDSLVTHIHLARQMGSLQIVLDLDTAEAPTYDVLPMADWVMVRIKPAGAPRPWTHRAS